MSLWGRSSQDTTWEDEEELEEERWGSSLPPKSPPSISLISGATKSSAHEVGGLQGAWRAEALLQAMPRAWPSPPL